MGLFYKAKNVIYGMSQKLMNSDADSMDRKKIEKLKALINLLPKTADNGWIIDGGSHIGRFAISARNGFPSSGILAFEPDPDSWTRAIKNVVSKKHKSIEVVQAALGAEKGKAEFFRGPIPVTNSLLPRPTDESKHYYPESATLEGGFFVDVVTIDEECEKRGITELDLLKLDLQGGELLALGGAKSLLGSGAIKVIMIEAVFVRKYKDQPLLWELWRHLESYGYSFFSLEGIKIGLYHAEKTSLRQMQWNQCDAIFISSAVRSALDN